MSRRVWFGRDAWLVADPKVEQLADEFGAEGVLGFEELLALAKIENNGGSCRSRYAILRKRACVRSKQRTQAIVAMCADLDLIQLEEADDVHFRVKVKRWTRWNDPNAAKRKQDQRASQKEAGNVTE